MEMLKDSFVSLGFLQIVKIKFPLEQFLVNMAIYIFETPRTQICCFQLSQKN